MGRRDDGKGGLAHCEGIRKTHRSGEVGAARSAAGPLLGSAMPREANWGRSNFSWGTFRCRRPSATLDASSGFDQPLMIALASSRLLELDAIVEGLPTNQDLRRSARITATMIFSSIMLTILCVHARTAIS